MSDTIIVGLVGLVSAVITALISAKAVSDKVTKQLEISQAVTDTKIEELTREVREHNNFAKRMPVVENEIIHIKDDIKHYHQ
jgi:hypothetical protein